MIPKYPAEWRTQSPWKKRFYARYMKWLERLGYTVVTLVLGAFVFAFNYRVDDVISADKVAIKAATTVTKFEEPVLVVRSVIRSFDEVAVGEPVLEIIRGEEAIDRFVAGQALGRLGAKSDFAMPKPEIIAAGTSGIFVIDESVLGQVVEQGETVSEVRNYDELELTAALAGQGVAAAKAGGVAKLKNPAVSSPNSILVRGKTSGGSLVSGRLFSPEQADLIGSSVKGMALGVRDDLSLEVESLVQLQIDADLSLGSGGSENSIQADPPASSQFQADVVDGKHLAVIQFARLPQSKQEEVNRAIQSVLNQRSVVDWSGTAQKVDSLSGLNTVFQVNAVPSKGSTGREKVDGTAISRTFEAKMKIKNPSDELKRVIRDADALGQTVTVRVELKTGDRPIAMLLLKRS
ncbi:hypothetical protein CCB80_02690 [Armatimonadetes bacterium Uphvl-Ar1]|nr:hypothetical protein CCB80_02690 [Armatimonadetes bacterium Uphvl-Ar1]